MGAVSGLGDSYDLPNFVGELFNITPNDTPFLSAIGGMTGGKSVTSKQFTWQTVDNATAAQTVVVEGKRVSHEMYAGAVGALPLHEVLLMSI